MTGDSPLTVGFSDYQPQSVLSSDCLSFVRTAIRTGISNPAVDNTLYSDFVRTGDCLADHTTELLSTVVFVD